MIRTVPITSSHEEIVATWIANLRDPENRQCKGVLTDGTANCCLGLLCRTVGLLPNDKNCFLGMKGVIPSGVRQAVKLYSPRGDFGYCSSLVSANDAGDTFPEIADIIESRPAGLFIADEATP